MLPPPYLCSPSPPYSGAWECFCWLHDVHWPSIQPRSTQNNSSDLNLESWGARNIGSTPSAGSPRTMPVTFWQYERKPSPAGTRMMNLWWSFLSIVSSWSPGHVCTRQSDRFYGPEKERGHHVPLTRNRPLNITPAACLPRMTAGTYFMQSKDHKRCLLLSFWSVVNGLHHWRSRFCRWHSTSASSAGAVRFLRASFLLPQCRAT